MNLTLGFDVYGTLIDTHGVVKQLQFMIGEDAPRFSQIWREKQLEYTFRRGVMKTYQNFGVCTRDALNYTMQFLGHQLNQDQQHVLIDAYSTLPAFDDAISGLEMAKQAGLNMYAFSNGQAAAVDTVLENAGIRDYFQGTVSVDTIQTFKPNLDVYKHFIETTGTTIDNAWLISSNSFDAIGAIAFGMKAAWIQRSTAVVLDPWEFKPTIILNSLNNLANEILNK